MYSVKKIKSQTGLLGLGLFAPALRADELNSGDTAWMLVATALVLFMCIPGLSLFYAGMVRSKNALSIMMQCFAITCLSSLIWVIYGYSLAFENGGSVQAFIGDLSKAFMSGVTVDALFGSIPESVFAMFQLTFARHYPGPSSLAHLPNA